MTTRPTMTPAAAIAGEAAMKGVTWIHGVTHRGTDAECPAKFNQATNELFIKDGAGWLLCWATGPCRPLLWPVGTRGSENLTYEHRNIRQIIRYRMYPHSARWFFLGRWDDRSKPRAKSPLESNPILASHAMTTHTLQSVGDDERMTSRHFIAVRSDGLTFLACLNATAGTIELVREFDRLYGTSLATRRTPIDRMIDEATGKQDDDMQAFLRFVWNCVFARTLPPTPDPA